MLQAKLKGSKLQASYSQDNRPLVLNLALLGFGLETSVTRGENRDHRLRHDFLVLSTRQAASASGQWSLEIPEIPVEELESFSPERFAIVIWITEPRSLLPLQATGGWL